MDFSNEYIGWLVSGVSYLAAAYILFFLGRLAYGWFHPSIKVGHELVEADNFAFSVTYVGYFVGLTLAIGSAIVGPSNGLVADLTAIGIYGVLAILLLNLSTIINDKLILRKFSVEKEIITDQNTGTGVVEAANSVASGLIIFGAVSGESAGLIEGLTTAVAFWLVGQVVMIITTRMYNAILPYDLHDHIERDNIAVGIGFAGALIAVANLIRFGLMGDFDGWIDTLSEVGLDVLIGLLFLPLARLLTDKILLPGRKLTDEIVNQEHPNNGAALVEAFAYIGGSVWISWCL